MVPWHKSVNDKSSAIQLNLRSWQFPTLLNSTNVDQLYTYKKYIECYIKTHDTQPMNCLLHYVFDFSIMLFHTEIIQLLNDQEFLETATRKIWKRYRYLPKMENVLNVPFFFPGRTQRARVWLRKERDTLCAQARQVANRDGWYELMHAFITDHTPVPLLRLE